MGDQAESAGRAAGFRDDTRERRMAVAREAEHRFDRKVAWGVRIDDSTVLFVEPGLDITAELVKRYQAKYPS